MMICNNINKCHFIHGSYICPHSLIHEYSEKCGEEICGNVVVSCTKVYDFITVDEMEIVDVD